MYARPEVVGRNDIRRKGGCRTVFVSRYMRGVPNEIRRLRPDEDGYPGQSVPVIRRGQESSMSFDHDDGLTDPCEKWDARDSDHDVDRLRDLEIGL